MSRLSSFLREEAGFEITEWSGVIALAAIAALVFRHEFCLPLASVLDPLIGALEAFLP